MDTEKIGVAAKITRDLRMMSRALRHDYLERDSFQAARMQLKRDYIEGGRVGPPPHIIKEEAILRESQAQGVRIFVETGTLHGDMIAALAADFDRLYSIELSPELYRLARLRFLGRSKIHLICGDSSEALGPLLAEIVTPCTFWLDGHYGGGVMAKGKKVSPVIEELTAILTHGVAGHVIFIDDVNIFENPVGGSPSLAELESLIRASWPSCGFYVEDNLIRVSPS